MKPISDFSMIVCADGNIFLDKIENKLKKGKGVFISVPVRLGLDRIEPECLYILKEVFTFESTLGIAGG